MTSVIDAVPQQCLRLPSSSFVPMLSAFTLGGFFIFGTYHWWWPAVVSMLVATGLICYWLWTGPSDSIRQATKDVGLGLTLPTYASGPASISWWAMFITMLADLTAFMSLIFGYFFFWTIHDDFPPKDATGPGVLWPVMSLAALLGAWGLVVLTRSLNRRNNVVGFYAVLSISFAMAGAGGCALLAGPWLTGLDPSTHVYPATVWLLVSWTVCHVLIGMIMQAYCLISRLAGRMTGSHDINIVNTILYWHFTALTVLLTVAVIAGFPLVD